MGFLPSFVGCGACAPTPNADTADPESNVEPASPRPERGGRNDARDTALDATPAVLQHESFSSSTPTTPPLQQRAFHGVIDGARSRRGSVEILTRALMPAWHRQQQHSSNSDEPVREKRHPWFKRGSAQAMETSFVPREHRHLIELAALLPQRVIENLVAQRRLGKQAKPGYAAKHMEAALLFIDISGFTASMEMFAQQGSKGIEKFWKMFNAYFCDLLDVIQGTGGDVDCFAGDAILIVYETERLWERTGDAVRDSIRGPDGGPPGKLTLATMAASQCGGRLLNKLSPYHFSDGDADSTLTLHGSIGAGSVRTVNIGGSTDQGDSWFETFVCGAVFEQLAVAHDLSGKSEFCLSGEAAALAGHWLDLYDHPEDEGCKILKGVKEPHDGPPGAPVYTSTPTITEARDEDALEAVQGLTPAKAMMPSFYRGESKHTDLFERLNLVHKEYETLSQDLKHFICRSVLEKMESTRGRGGSEGGATLGELRRGTVGFVKFDIKDINSVSCPEPENGIRDVAQVAMLAIREVLIAGGYVNKVIMDEKGLVLLFAFGTPGCSYEHNNLHAIRVALMIVKSSQLRFRRETGIGIATGNMCTGLIGKPNFRSEYALAGDVVNLAARLAASAEKAKQGVLCDETTLKSLVGEDSKHESAMASIKVVSVGSMRPKGKSYDIEVFKLNNVSSRNTDVMRNKAVPVGDAVAGVSTKTSLEFVPVTSRAVPLEQMRTMLRECQSGAVCCLYLESDAGLGKSALITALCGAPTVPEQAQRIGSEGEEAGFTKRREAEQGGDQFEVVGERDIHVAKVQAAHLEQSTPYYVLSELVKILITLIVEPDRHGCINMEEVSAAMPPEAQRYLELLRYLRVPMGVPKTGMSNGKHSRKGSLASRRSNRRRTSDASGIAKCSEGHRSRRGSLLGYSCDDENMSTGGTSYGYRFQRFHGEEEENSDFDSARGLTTEAAEVLCEQMKAGIEVKDRDYGSTVFKNAFMGSEAVDWIITQDYAGSRVEAAAIGQRLVEFGLVDHVNSIFRFKDDVLFFKFQDRSTPWPRAIEMDLDSAKALGLRINMEIQVITTQNFEGVVHKACFSGGTVVGWMIKERVATCLGESVAIADKLMAFGVIESIDPGLERFKPTEDCFYLLRALALTSLPPMHIFSLLQQLCLSILHVACAMAARNGQLVLVVIEDLHWADAGTLDMILTFLQVGREDPWYGGCMFLLATRPASAFPAHHRKTRDRIVTETEITTMVQLEALSEREAERLTCSFLEVDELDFGLRKLVVTSCSGSPLFIAEMCQSLCATKGVQTVITSTQKSRAALKNTGQDGTASSVPTSVQEIVAARIDTLDSTVGLVLKVAAVIGETFTFDVLEAVFPLDLDGEVLKKHLAALVSGNFLTISKDAAGGSQCYRFTHSMMSFAAYGMLLHSYRWRLHYRVAMVMTAQGQEYNMALARHWLQVAQGEPTSEEIKDLGGPEAHLELLRNTIVTVSQAIGELMSMGQFIDASLFFKEGLEVLERMPDTPGRKILEIELLLQGCQLTQFIEGYTTSLLAYAKKAYALACEETEGVRPETRVRAGLFVEQYEVMYGDACAAIERLQGMFEDIPKKEAALRMEPAAILAAVLTQRGQFAKARACTKVIEEWKAAGSPPPLCLAMYEPVVTLMSMNAILAATSADDSRHLRWMNELERYLKDSTASKQPFNLYASMSLFGMLYPMCFEYAEMVRFYHAVYRVVYHPQVLLPVRRGLMFQAATATSRVHARNAIITQGIEIMSLMCKVYEAVNTTASVTARKKPKHFFNELMSIVRSQPTAAACAAVYQAARILHLWAKAREVIDIWDALTTCDVAIGGPRVSSVLLSKDPSSTVAQSSRFRSQSEDGEAAVCTFSVTDNRKEILTIGKENEENRNKKDDGATDIYRAIRLYCKADVEVEEIKDELERAGEEPPEEGHGLELSLVRYREATKLFAEAAADAASIGNGLMEVRAAASYSRILWERLDEPEDSRARLRQVFDKFDTLCSLPNFFTPLRLTGLTAAMRLNSDMGGCYDSSDEGDSDEYGFAAAMEDDSASSSEEDDSAHSTEEESCEDTEYEEVEGEVDENGEIGAQGGDNGEDDVVNTVAMRAYTVDVAESQGTRQEVVGPSNKAASDSSNGVPNNSTTPVVCDLIPANSEFPHIFPGKRSEAICAVATGPASNSPSTSPNRSDGPAMRRGHDSDGHNNERLNSGVTPPWGNVKSQAVTSPRRFSRRISWADDNNASDLQVQIPDRESEEGSDVAMSGGDDAIQGGTEDKFGMDNIQVTVQEEEWVQAQETDPTQPQRLGVTFAEQEQSEHGRDAQHISCGSSSPREENGFRKDDVSRRKEDTTPSPRSEVATIDHEQRKLDLNTTNSLHNRLICRDENGIHTDDNIGLENNDTARCVGAINACSSNIAASGGEAEGQGQGSAANYIAEGGSPVENGGGPENYDTQPYVNQLYVKNENETSVRVPAQENSAEGKVSKADGQTSSSSDGEAEPGQHKEVEVGAGHHATAQTANDVAGGPEPGAFAYESADRERATDEKVVRGNNNTASSPKCRQVGVNKSISTHVVDTVERGIVLGLVERTERLNPSLGRGRDTVKMRDEVVLRYDDGASVPSNIHAVELELPRVFPLDKFGGVGAMFGPAQSLVDVTTQQAEETTQAAVEAKQPNGADGADESLPINEVEHVGAAAFGTPEGPPLLFTDTAGDGADTARTQDEPVDINCGLELDAFDDPDESTPVNADYTIDPSGLVVFGPVERPAAVAAQTAGGREATSRGDAVDTAHVPNHLPMGINESAPLARSDVDVLGSTERTLTCSGGREGGTVKAGDEVILRRGDHASVPSTNHVDKVAIRSADGNSPLHVFGSCGAMFGPVEKSVDGATQQDGNTTTITVEAEQLSGVDGDNKAIPMDEVEHVGDAVLGTSERLTPLMFTDTVGDAADTTSAHNKSAERDGDRATVPTITERLKLEGVEGTDESTPVNAVYAFDSVELAVFRPSERLAGVAAETTGGGGYTPDTGNKLVLGCDGSAPVPSGRLETELEIPGVDGSTPVYIVDNVGAILNHSETPVDVATQEDGGTTKTAEEAEKPSGEESTILVGSGGLIKPQEIEQSIILKEESFSGGKETATDLAPRAAEVTTAVSFTPPGVSSGNIFPAITSITKYSATTKEPLPRCKPQRGAAASASKKEEFSAQEHQAAASNIPEVQLSKATAPDTVVGNGHMKPTRGPQPPMVTSGRGRNQTAVNLTVAPGMSSRRPVENIGGRRPPVAGKGAGQTVATRNIGEVPQRNAPQQNLLRRPSGTMGAPQPRRPSGTLVSTQSSPRRPFTTLGTPRRTSGTLPSPQGSSKNMLASTPRRPSGTLVGTTRRPSAPRAAEARLLATPPKGRRGGRGPYGDGNKASTAVVNSNASASTNETALPSGVNGRGAKTGAPKASSLKSEGEQLVSISTAPRAPVAATAGAGREGRGARVRGQRAAGRGRSTPVRG